MCAVSARVQHWRMLLLLIACASPGEDCADFKAADSGMPADYEPPAVSVIQLLTDDGVTLEADWYGHEYASTAVLLLHMIPPGNDRTDWPVEWIESLRAEGLAVLALDRRGAGGSGGEASDAYDGPLGVNDANAAVDFVVEQGFPEVLVVAASNGTTTALDYATSASPDRPEPRAMVWMSPGTYTTTNSDIEDLDTDELLFVYPPEEASWVDRVQRNQDPDQKWTYAQCEGGEHGTLMFAAYPEVAGIMTEWIAGTD